MRPVPIAQWSTLHARVPVHALVEEVDLVVIRWPEPEESVSVLYGRCLHRGALLADGHVEGENLSGVRYGGVGEESA